MKYTQELKEKILEEVKQSRRISSVAKKHGIPDSTIHTWLKKKELKPQSDLFLEVKRLKKKLSESEQSVTLLKDMLKKSYQIFDRN